MSWAANAPARRDLSGTENADCTMSDSRKGWGQLVPNSFQSGFILSGHGPSPPLFVRILESAVWVQGLRLGRAMTTSRPPCCHTLSRALIVATPADTSGKAALLLPFR